MSEDMFLSKIPPEIVYEILSYQFKDLMSNDHPSNSEKYHANIRAFLTSNATVNMTFNHVCRVLVYRYLNFTTARSFHKLLNTLKEGDEGLRKLVEVADFQEFSSIGLGRTGEMNKTIKNLTNETLWEFLMLTADNLREFLASEHIQQDIDQKIIYFLFAPGTVLSVVDFCGCSGTAFSQSFVAAVDKFATQVTSKENFQITCLGLNDCTDIPSRTLGKLLGALPELQKLDLTNTAIDDETLINHLPHWKNLTHLSFGDCLQLTPRGVLEFFSYHPAVTDANNNETLQWLNVQVHAHTSTWTETQTLFLLKKLCQYGHNKTLEYLNIGGFPLHFSDDPTVINTPYYHQCQDTLLFIKLNFPHLKSLNLKDISAPYERLVNFLSPLAGDKDMEVQQELKFLNISNNSYINKWTIEDQSLFICSGSLLALELSFDPWQQIENANERHEKICFRSKNNKKSLIQDISKMESVKWKCYIDSSYGRRHWLYKCDRYLNRDDIDKAGSFAKYDSNGNKIIEIVQQPDFLKFAQNKIMLGCGLNPLSSSRRKTIYKDMKPPISRFFRRDGKIALSQTHALPILSPRRPPGGWRIIRNDEDDTTEDDSSIAEGISPNIRNSFPSLSSIPEARPVLTSENTRDAIFWDRSAVDRRSVDSESESTETDYDYINDPELQRRRSQMSLFNNPVRARSRGSLTSPSNLSNLTVALKGNAQQQNQLHTQYSQQPTQYDNNKKGNKLCSTFIYDPNDPEMNTRVLNHHWQTQEYKVFGATERGMYRYYSLKT